MLIRSAMIVYYLPHKNIIFLWKKLREDTLCREYQHIICKI